MNPPQVKINSPHVDSQKQQERWQELFDEAKSRLAELAEEMKDMDQTTSEYKKLFWETDRLNAQLTHSARSLQASYEKDFQFKSAQI